MNFEQIPVPEKEQDGEKKYRISWKSKETGATGHGEYLDKEEAESWLENANKENPEIEHWLEPETEKEK